MSIPTPGKEREELPSLRKIGILSGLTGMVISIIFTIVYLAVAPYVPLLEPAPWNEISILIMVALTTFMSARGGAKYWTKRTMEVYSDENSGDGSNESEAETDDDGERNYE
ncbi:MAG: hypothetical protein ABEK59_06685 [Halobacteria archaeon]